MNLGGEFKLSSLIELEVWRKQEYQVSTRTVKDFAWIHKHVKYQLEINHIIFFCGHIALEMSVIPDSLSEAVAHNL